MVAEPWHLLLLCPSYSFKWSSYRLEQMTYELNLQKGAIVLIPITVYSNLFLQCTFLYAEKMCSCSFKKLNILSW